MNEFSEIAKVINNNQPGWSIVIETAPHVTLDIGAKLYVKNDKQWTYQDRVAKEKEDLDLKVKKLNKFISSPYFIEMDDFEQSLLQKQLKIMGDYSIVLAQRVCVFRGQSNQY